MKSLEEMKLRFGETVKRAKEVQEAADTDDRALTAEEKGSYKALMDEHDELAEEIGRRERLVKAEQSVLQVAKRQTEPQQPETRQVETSVAALPRRDYGTLRAFQARKGETYHEACQRAYRSGQWLMAVVFGSARAALWCREHGLEMRAQSEGVNTKGGALVPTELDMAIIDLREQYGVFRQNAKVVPMGSDHKIVPRRTGGVTAYAIGEQGTITASDKSWDQVELTARKWGALIKYSSEVADDAVISLADDLAQEIAYAFANKEDDAAFNGDGTSTYHGSVGFLTKMIDGNHTKSYYTAPGAGNTMDIMSEITDAALAGVMGQAPAYVYARGKPKWYCPVTAKSLVFHRLQLAAGGNTKADLGGAMVDSYAGYPIVPVPVWTGTGATDFSAIIAILFGDMALASMLGDRRGTRIKVSSDRYLETDELAIVGTTRFDVNVHDVGDTSVAGPIVGLLGN